MSEELEKLQSEEESSVGKPEQEKELSTREPETEEKNESSTRKKGGKFFQKIPKEFLFSPAGIILIFLAIFFEILDLFLPGGSLTIEIIPDLIFGFFLTIFAKVPWQSSILPFIIERIPLISDILPTWLIRMFL